MSITHNDVAFVANCRKETAEYEAEVSKTQAELETTPEWKRLAQLKDQLQQSRQAQVEAEDNLRRVTLAFYANDQDKHPHPALTVKMFGTMAYESVDAKAYCIAHLPAALKLDTKAFEKAVKVLALDFVTLGEEPRVTIASDLSEWEAWEK